MVPAAEFAKEKPLVNETDVIEFEAHSFVLKIPNVVTAEALAVPILIFVFGIPKLFCPEIKTAPPLAPLFVMMRPLFQPKLLFPS